MTRILQLSIALFMIGNVGFAQECTTESCQRLIAEITEKCACGALNAAECEGLLQLVEDEDCPEEMINAKMSSINKVFWPITDGSLDGFNISIHYNKEDENVYARVIKIDGGKASPEVADIDLSTKTVELYFTSDKNTTFIFRSYDGNQLDKYGTEPAAISVPKSGLDVKLIPKLADGSGPGFVGGNDARDLKTDEGVSTPLGYDDFPFNRKVVVHYKKNAKSLQFAGSKTVTLKTGSIDPNEVGKIRWGINMDKYKK